MKKKIKCLMLVPNLRVSNGVTSYAMNYFRAIDHNRIEMDFCLLDDIESPFYDEIRRYGGKIFILPSLRRIGAHLSKCYEIVKNGKYDIIHDNSLLKTIPIMKIASKFIPVRILHSHNSRLGETIIKEKRNACLLPILRKQANAYASCSDMAAKAMFGDSEYEFIPNIVDPEAYHFDLDVRISTRIKMDTEDRIVIGTVGRLAPQKNPFFALGVFDKLAEKEPKVEYWWIGSGPLDQEVAEYVNKLNHSDRVKLLGSRTDIISLYQAIDVFFLPSFFEGLPVTGIEAQAMGIPCAISAEVTKEVAFTDLVAFVPLKASIETWVKALEEQIRRIPERCSYTRELENSVFSSANAGERLENYYRKLLNEVTF